MNPRAGHFRLVSGHHGELWLDLEALFMRPARLRPFVEDLAGRLAGFGAEAICGAPGGGAFVALMVAATLNVEFAHAERAGGEHRIVDSVGAALTGRPVAVVDDVINAGSDVTGTLAALRRCDARPVALGALLVLGHRAAELASAERLHLTSLAYLPTPIWTPQECPLCAAAVPFEEA